MHSSQRPPSRRGGSSREQPVGDRPGLGRHQTTPSAAQRGDRVGVEPELGEHGVGVGAEHRRAGRYRDGFADEPRVRRLLAHGTDDRIVDGIRSPARRELGVGEHVGRSERGRHRHVVLDARGLHLGRRSAPRSRRRRSPLISSLWAARSTSFVNRVIGEQVGPLHRRAQPGEVGVRAGDDAHVLAVGGGVVVEGRAVREAVALARPDNAETVVRRDRPLEDAQRRAVQRRVDDRAVSAAGVARVERRGGGLGREHPGQVVGDRDADPNGRAIGVAGEVEEPAVADAHAVEAGALRVRTVLAERGDAHGHELRVEGAGCDVPALERARPEVLDDDVGRRRERSEELLAARRAEVERHAAPPSPLDRPEERVALFGEGSDLAHEVAGAGLFDLDHLGTLLAEQTRAERRGDARAEVEDPEARERSGHVDVDADSPACSALTASMPPARRASVRPVASAVLLTNWCTMKWYCQDSR